MSVLTVNVLYKMNRHAELVELMYNFHSVLRLTVKIYERLTRSTERIPFGTMIEEKEA